MFKIKISRTRHNHPIINVGGGSTNRGTAFAALLHANNGVYMLKTATYVKRKGAIASALDQASVVISTGDILITGNVVKVSSSMVLNIAIAQIYAIDIDSNYAVLSNIAENTIDYPLADSNYNGDDYRVMLSNTIRHMLQVTLPHLMFIEEDIRKTADGAVEYHNRDYRFFANEQRKKRYKG